MADEAKPADEEIEPGDDDLDRVSEALQSELNPGEAYLLILVTPTPTPKGVASRVRTASTVDGDVLRLLCEVTANIARNRAGAGQLNAVELAALPVKRKERMFETLEAIVRGSERIGIPPQAWRDLFLIWAAQMAHDQGVSREAWLAQVLDGIEEEWSTPNTEGRAAVRELVSKAAPR